MKGKGSQHSKRSRKQGAWEKKRASQKQHRKLMEDHKRRRKLAESLTLARQKARRAKFLEQVQSGDFGIPKIKEDTKDNE